MTPILPTSSGRTDTVLGQVDRVMRQMKTVIEVGHPKAPFASII